MKNIKPFNNQILVKVLDHEKKSEGGLYLKNPEEHSVADAEIIAVGTGDKVQEFKVGQVLCILRWMGTEIDLERKMIGDDAILGVYENVSL